MRATLRQRSAQVGLVLVLLVVLVALLGPLLSPHGPEQLLAAPFAPAGGDGLALGADTLGRDALSRFLHGGRVIVAEALLATVLGVGAGALLGLVAGYVRGGPGALIMRALDVVLSFPAVVLALLFLSVLGAQWWLVVLTIAASHAPRTARVVLAATLGLVGREYVQYAEAIGVSRTRIMLRELLPNIVSPLTVEFGLRLTYSTGLVAALGYLGFGPRPPAADWGAMINENQAGITVQPWPVALPIIAIAVLTIGTNLLTDAFARATAGIDRAVGPEVAAATGSAPAPLERA